MKKSAIALALAILAMGAAQAQTATFAPETKRLRLVAGVGLTAGGDKLASVTYEDLGDYDIKAGGLIVFTGGVDFLVTPVFSLQSTVSYHVDQANASNGDVKFKRYPIELLAYYHPSAQWRVGGGVRYVSSPKLSSSGAARALNDEFDNTVSGLVEAEYFFNPQFGLKLRFVHEEYESKRYRDKVDAKHIGIFANFYF